MENVSIQIIQWEILITPVNVMNKHNIFLGMVNAHIVEILSLVVQIVKIMKHVLYVIQMDFSNLKVDVVFVLMDITYLMWYV